jgi:hypothetical protein
MAFPAARAASRRPADARSLDSAGWFCLLAPEKGRKEVPLLCPKEEEVATLLQPCSVVECRQPRRVGCVYRCYVPVGAFRALMNQHPVVKRC